MTEGVGLLFLALGGLVLSVFAMFALRVLDDTLNEKKSTTTNVVVSATLPASNAGTVAKFTKECKLPETRGEPVTRPGCLVLLRDGQVFTVHQGKEMIIVARNDPIGWYKHIRSDELFKEDGDFVRIIFPDDPDYEKYARAFITTMPVKE
jgi:hypothetical protein